MLRCVTPFFVYGTMQGPEHWRPIVYTLALKLLFGATRVRQGATTHVADSILLSSTIGIAGHERTVEVLQCESLRRKKWC